MGILDELLEVHKETVLIDGNGFAVDCVLKPTSTHSGFNLQGFSTFIGLSFNENGVGFFGDSFELTINVKSLKKLTDLIPTRAWSVGVKFPQMNGELVNFKIEDVATDRTLGTYLIKCSASATSGSGMIVKRQPSGGM